MTQTKVMQLKRHLQKFSNVKQKVIREGKYSVSVFTARAHKNTPIMKRDIYSNSPRVHVGTYVHDTGRVFKFSSKYAIKKKR